MIQDRPTHLDTQRAIRRSLDSVELSPPRVHQSLTVWFLLGGATRTDYVLLDHALAEGSVDVTEVNGCSVPVLLLENRGERPVFLADGEELLGGMQNRSLNLSILAPAKASITIPVSCMEAGRWNYDQPGAEGGRGMRGSGAIMNARLRLSRMRSVSVAMRQEAGSRQSNQEAIWSEIDGLAESLDARSDTRAINLAFERYAKQLDDYVEALRPERDVSRRACGAVFAIDGGGYGLDLFDARPTFKSLYPKLVRSWSLDALAAGRERSAATGTGVDPAILLDRLARRRSRVYAGVGLGVDARLARRQSRLHGAALVAGGRAVHVSAIHPGFAT